MIATVMYMVSWSSLNLIWTCTSQSIRMARMFPVTSFPSRYFGLTACSVYKRSKRAHLPEHASIISNQQSIFSANLKLTEIQIDVLDIFTAQHGIIIVICIHILDIKQNIRERLTQIIRSTARGLHGNRRRRLRQNLQWKAEVNLFGLRWQNRYFKDSE